MRILHKKSEKSVNFKTHPSSLLSRETFRNFMANIGKAGLIFGAFVFAVKTNNPVTIATFYPTGLTPTGFFEQKQLFRKLLIKSSPLGRFLITP